MCSSDLHRLSLSFHRLMMWQVDYIFILFAAIVIHTAHSFLKATTVTLRFMSADLLVAVFCCCSFLKVKSFKNSVFAEFVLDADKGFLNLSFLFELGVFSFQQLLIIGFIQ